MYPVSWTGREAPPAVSGQVTRVGLSVWGTGGHPPASGLKGRGRDLSADSGQRTADAGPNDRCRLATLSGASSAQAAPMSPPTPTREAFYPWCSAGARQTAELTGAARWMINPTPLSRGMFPLYTDTTDTHRSRRNCKTWRRTDLYEHFYEQISAFTSRVRSL